MSEKFWIVVITTIIGPSLGWIGKILWDYYKTRNKNAVGEYIDLIRDIYYYLEIARKDLGCARAVVLKAENGGGIPKPGHQIYSSVLWESTDAKTPSIRKKWQKQPVDEEYTKILAQLYQNKSVQIYTKSMEESQLKNLYLATKIHQSQVFHIYHDEAKFIYLSLNYEEDVDINSPYHKDIERQIIVRLKDIFSKIRMTH